MAYFGVESSFRFGVKMAGLGSRFPHLRPCFLGAVTEISALSSNCRSDFALRGLLACTLLFLNTSNCLPSDWPTSQVGAPAAEMRDLTTRGGASHNAPGCNL